jgi:diaminohydroxyphosphoribosylaminopyrimidine deaminase/5-amino-6-(5-phosphoribosylamino)uracil reductase
MVSQRPPAASATTTEADLRHMGAALELARRGLGRTWPNPSVGCVIVRDGRVVGRGATRAGGRPHAETEALAHAGEAARGATAYVSLEPCAHHGRTPPCTDALIAAGLARVVVAMEDPDPRTAGQGIVRLREAGIRVDVGACAEQAVRVNAGFVSRVTRLRPLVTLKVAATLDGRVALDSGLSKWITGEEARRRGHLLRANHDGILVGAGTVRADDPALTCRIAGLEGHQPVRVVADSGLRTPSDSLLARSIEIAPLWLVCGEGAPQAAADAWRARGAEVIDVRRGDDGRLSLAAMMIALGDRGLTRVLVEGGPELSTSLLRAGLVDSLVWFQAPKLLGADARSALGGLDVLALDQAIAGRSVALARVGDDTMLTLDIARH